MDTKKLHIFILSYEDNINQAMLTKNLLKKEYEIEAEIILGYSLIKDTQLNKNHVVYNGVLDKILPRCECDHDLLILEDDVIFTSNPLEKIEYDRDIVWCVYRKRLKNGDIVGAQAIYYNHKILQLLKDNMSSHKARHYDGYLSKFINNNNLNILIITPSIGYERLHNSLISKEKYWIKYTKPPTQLTKKN